MEIVIQVLIQVLIVIGLSRLVGLGFRRLNQPLVIGEIVAGILLGPSLFGLIAPDVAAAIFPAETISYLNVLSQIGLIFFMFLIGLELDPKYMKNQLESALLISHVSILVPFCFGSLLALLLYPLLSDASVNFTAFTLFLGSAMSLTAFPVLARIITENNLQKSRLGILALTSAALGDLAAWWLLALSIAVTRTNSMAGAIPTIFKSLVYIALIIAVGRTFLPKLSTFYNRTGRLTQFLLALIYMGVVVSALITEWIGIHLIFGAFLLGVVMPKNEGLTRELAQKTEDFVLTFLLPVFFAYSGLKTEIGLLNRPELWLLCVLVIAVATIGKYLGTFGAAKFCGISNRDASILGWLMNTRGLTELIVLNIGLSLNVISPLLFTMLVIMALVTTFITSPMLAWLYPKQPIKKQVLKATPASFEPKYRVLVPIANPESQKGLIEIAVALAQANSKVQQNAVVYPLSLIQLEEDYAFESTPAEANRLIAQRKAEIDLLINTTEIPANSQLIQPIVTIANDVAKETALIAERDRMNLIVLGWHRPAFSNNRLGGRVGQILSTAKVDVAVFVDRQISKWENLLVPYVPNIHNDLGLELALRLTINRQECQLTVLRVVRENLPTEELSYEFKNIMDRLPASVKERITIANIHPSDGIAEVVEASRCADLTIAGASREWGLERQTLGGYADELAFKCHSSLLIARKYSQVTSHLSSVL